MQERATLATPMSAPIQRPAKPWARSAHTTMPAIGNENAIRSWRAYSAIRHQIAPPASALISAVATPIHRVRRVRVLPRSVSLTMPPTGVRHRNGGTRDDSGAPFALELARRRAALDRSGEMERRDEHAFAKIELMCLLALRAGIERERGAAGSAGDGLQMADQRAADTLRALRFGGNEVV